MWKIPKSLVVLLLCLSMTTTQHEQFTVFTKTYDIPNKEVLIKKWSLIYDLDYSLVRAIVKVESDFNHNMKNPKSTSSGLFGQIKGTLAWTAEMEGYEIDCLARDLQVEEQIYMGTRYIYYLKQKYKGNVRKILKEYCSEKGYYEKVMKEKAKYDI